MFLWTADGNQVSLDVIMSIKICLLGYSHPIAPAVHIGLTPIFFIRRKLVTSTKLFNPTSRTSWRILKHKIHNYHILFSYIIKNKQTLKQCHDVNVIIVFLRLRTVNIIFNEKHELIHLNFSLGLVHLYQKNKYYRFPF